MKTYPNGRIYLAGPIAGLTYDECTEWRNNVMEVMAANGIAAMSPMRGKSFLKAKGALDGTYDESLISGQRAIFDRDYNDCTKADVLLVNLKGANRVSIGTMFELAWAKSHQIPVVLVMDDGDPFHDHAFVREAASFRAPDLTMACDIILGMLLPHQDLL